jgi:hypothetical protein
MNTTKTLSKWARAVAPALLAVLVVGCSGSNTVGPVIDDNPLGPGINNTDRVQDDAEAIIGTDRNVDIDNTPGPQRLDQETTDLRTPQKIMSIDRSVDRNRLSDPLKTSNPADRIVDVNNVPTPDRTSNIQGRYIEIDNVPGTQR